MIYKELLSHTDLGIANVSKHAIFDFVNIFYLAYKFEFGIALNECRQKIRKEGDVGRFKLLRQLQKLISFLYGQY